MRPIRLCIMRFILKPQFETSLFERNKAYLGGGLSFVTGYELGVLEPTNKLAMVSCVFQYNIARLGSAVNLMPWTSPSTGMVAKVEIQDSIFSYNSVLYNTSSWYLMGFGTVYTYKVPFDINGRVRTSFYSNKGSGIIVVGTVVNIHSGSVGFLHNVATNGGAILPMPVAGLPSGVEPGYTSLPIWHKVEVGPFTLNQQEGTKLLNPGTVLFVILNGGCVMMNGTLICILTEIWLMKVAMIFLYRRSSHASGVALVDLLTPRLRLEERCFVQDLCLFISAISQTNPL